MTAVMSPAAGLPEHVSFNPNLGNPLHTGRPIFGQQGDGTNQFKGSIPSTTIPPMPSLLLPSHHQGPSTFFNGTNNRATTPPESQDQGILPFKLKKSSLKVKSQSYHNTQTHQSGSQVSRTTSNENQSSPTESRAPQRHNVRWDSPISKTREIPARKETPDLEGDRSSMQICFETLSLTLSTLFNPPAPQLPPMPSAMLRQQPAPAVTNSSDDILYACTSESGDGTLGNPFDLSAGDPDNKLEPMVILLPPPVKSTHPNRHSTLKAFTSPSRNSAHHTWTAITSANLRPIIESRISAGKATQNSFGPDTSPLHVTPVEAPATIATLAPRDGGYVLGRTGVTKSKDAVVPMIVDDLPSFGVYVPQANMMPDSAGTGHPFVSQCAVGDIAAASGSVLLSQDILPAHGSHSTIIQPSHLAPTTSFLVKRKRPVALTASNNGVPDADMLDAIDDQPPAKFARTGEETRAPVGARQQLLSASEPVSSKPTNSTMDVDSMTASASVPSSGPSEECFIEGDMNLLEDGELIPFDGYEFEEAEGAEVIPFNGYEFEEGEVSNDSGYESLQPNIPNVLAPNRAWVPRTAQVPHMGTLVQPSGVEETSKAAANEDNARRRGSFTPVVEIIRSVGRPKVSTGADLARLGTVPPTHEISRGFGSSRIADIAEEVNVRGTVPTSNQVLEEEESLTREARDLLEIFGHETDDEEVENDRRSGHAKQQLPGNKRPRQEEEELAPRRRNPAQTSSASDDARRRHSSVASSSSSSTSNIPKRSSSSSGPRVRRRLPAVKPARRPQLTQLLVIGWKNGLTSYEQLYNDGKVDDRDREKLDEWVTKIDENKDHPALSLEWLSVAKIGPVMKRFRHNMGHSPETKRKVRAIWNFWNERWAVE